MCHLCVILAGHHQVELLPSLHALQIKGRHSVPAKISFLLKCQATMFLSYPILILSITSPP